MRDSGIGVVRVEAEQGANEIVTVGEYLANRGETGNEVNSAHLRHSTPPGDEEVGVGQSDSDFTEEENARLRNSAPLGDDEEVGVSQLLDTILSEEKDDTKGIKLQRDTNSILFVADLTWPWKDFAFWYALITFLLQEGVLILIILEVFLNAPSYNHLNFPPHVDDMVRTAQGMALFVSLLTQDDVISAIDEVLDAKYEEKLKEKAPGVSCAKFYFSLICRFLQGMTTTAVSFILVVQSSEVLELFLNFAAVSFVSTIDNAAFEFGRRGYITSGVQDVTKVIRDKRMKLPRRSWRSANIIRRCLFCLLLLLLFGLWGYAIWMQKDNRYYCPSIQVYFGDGLTSTLNELLVSDPVISGNSRISSAFGFVGLNGLYMRSTEKLKIPVYRPDFQDSRHANTRDAARGIFFYNERERAWVFFH